MTDAPDTRPALALVPVGPGVEIPPGLGPALDAVFGTRAHLAAPLPLDPAWHHAERGQWLSGAVVDALLARHAAEGAHGWMLGVTAADLYVPERTFVFGEATVGGPCALVSVARLRAGADRGLLLRRLVTEAVHELGHLAGLGHCPNPCCAMARSPDVDGVDAKGAAPCEGCQPRMLHEAVPR